MLDMGSTFYPGACVIYDRGIMETIAEDVRADLAVDGDESGGYETPTEAIDAVVERSLSALKLLTLDQQVAVDTDIHPSNQRVEAELRRRKEVGREAEAAVEETQTAADDLARSAEQLSATADDQAGSVSEVSGGVSTMSATIEEIAATADDIAAANEEQSANVTQIRESVRRLNRG